MRQFLEHFSYYCFPSKRTFVRFFSAKSLVGSQAPASTYRKNAPLLAVALFAACPTLSAVSQVLPAAPFAARPTGHSAVIAFNDAVLKTNEAQRAFGDLQNKFAPREAQLKALNLEIDELKKQLNIDSGKLSDQERTTRVQTIEAKEKQLQREAEDYKNDSQTESQQVFEGIAQKVYAFLQGYSEQHGYALVIDRGSAENPIVWFAASSVDITGQLVEAYNSQAAVSGRPASKPTASQSTK